MSQIVKFLDSYIHQVTPMGRPNKTGDLFGLELECEGRNVDWDGRDLDIRKAWEPHRDGSLRDNHGSSCEWVFRGPATYKKSQERVKILFEYFNKRKAQLVTSNRTSTHVHYNVGDKKAYQVVNLFILFTILEDLLDRYCGEDRKGNLFCLSSRHAEEQVRWFEDCIFMYQTFRFNENQRYCSLNLASLNKFGTVEFRGMRGLDNEEDVLSWLSIINELCEFACYKMKNPSSLIEEISVKTPLGFLKEIFSEDNFKKLTNNLNYDEVRNSIYEGLRLVQMLSYKIGEDFDKVKIVGKDFWASFNEDREIENFDEPVFLAVDEPAPRRGLQRVQLRNLRGAPDLQQQVNAFLENVFVNEDGNRVMPAPIDFLNQPERVRF